MNIAGCKICQNQREKYGELKIYEDKYWLVRHSQETNILGYCVIESNRHFLDLCQASEQECASYGILLGQLMRAIRSIIDCKRVYTFSLAEIVPHFHVHVIPRTVFMPRAYQGRGIMSYPLQPAADKHLVADTCLQLRRELKIIDNCGSKLRGAL